MFRYYSQINFLKMMSYKVINSNAILVDNERTAIKQITRNIMNNKADGNGGNNTDAREKAILFIKSLKSIILRVKLKYF